MSSSLYLNVLETQEWFIRNENELSKAEFREWIEINNRASYSDDERRLLSDIRKKYDEAYRLSLELRKTAGQIDALNKPKTKALPAASCEVLIDDKKLVEKIAALKGKEQYWKARCHRAEDKNHWLQVELQGLKQTTSINEKARQTR